MVNALTLAVSRVRRFYTTRSYHEAVTVAGQTETSETYRQQALQYVRGKIAEILAEETPEHFTKVGITVVIGEAVFTGKNTLTVHGETYTFKKAIIATGSSPRTTDIPGLSESYRQTVIGGHMRIMVMEKLVNRIKIE